MDQKETQNVANESVRVADYPPLRVHHLLILTAVTAIYATVLRWMSGERWQTPDSFFMIVLFANGLLCSSGQLFVCAVVVYWRVQRTIMCAQPGEWIAIYGALESLFWFGIFGLVSYYEDQLRGAHASSMVVTLFPTAAFALLLSGVFIWLAVRRRDWHGWRSVFFLLGVSQLSQAVGGMFLWASNIEQFTVYDRLLWVRVAAEALALLFVGIILTRDVLRKVRWRWTHWWGIALWVLEQIPGYAQFLFDWWSD